MSTDTSLPPLVEPDARTGQRRMRTWPAALVLLVQAPAVAEMLSGSTPPLLFFSPKSLIFQCGLYGCGALLIRDVVRRRGLGWASVLLLGAAYGVLEEGLVITSWFNPYWPDLGPLATVGRALNTNWLWALGLTAYHMIVSAAIPIILAEALFPCVAVRPWLGRAGALVAALWLWTIAVVGLLGFGFVEFRAQGYTHPPVLWFGALILAVLLVLAGLLVPPMRSRAPVYRASPSLWQLRASAFALTVAYFFNLWMLPRLVSWAWLIALALVAAVGLGLAWTLRWSRGPGWSGRHRLALATGVLGFFLLLAPLHEFVVRGPKLYGGMTLVALGWLALLVWLSRRAERCEHDSHLSTAA
jgi:hypothetical protein